MCCAPPAARAGPHDRRRLYEKARHKAAEELSYLTDDAVFQARTDKTLTERTEATRYQALRTVDTIAYMVAKLYDLELPSRFTEPRAGGGRPLPLHHGRGAALPL